MQKKIIFSYNDSPEALYANIRKAPNPIISPKSNKRKMSKPIKNMHDKAAS